MFFKISCLTLTDSILVKINKWNNENGNGNEKTLLLSIKIKNNQKFKIELCS